MVAISLLLNTLVKDSSELRKYGRSIGGTGVRRDGSGGVVTWASTHYRWTAPRYHDLRPHNEPYDLRVMRADREYTTAFVLEQDSSKLRILPRLKPTLFQLPRDIRFNIFNHVIYPAEGIHINLDREESLPLGFLNVNRDTVYWRSTFICQNDFYLSMESDKQHTKFSDFEPLGRVLRKKFFDICDPTNYGRNIIEGQVGEEGQLHFELFFNLESPTTPDMLQISILPFVLEISSIDGFRGEYFTISYPRARASRTVQAKQRVHLRTLRYNVSEALKKLVDGPENRLRLIQPEMWVNGFGEVMETRIKSGPQSLQTALGISRRLAVTRTVKDKRYKANSCSQCHTK